MVTGTPLTPRAGSTAATYLTSASDGTTNSIWLVRKRLRSAKLR